jgi:hypothetical protein
MIRIEKPTVQRNPNLETATLFSKSLLRLQDELRRWIADGWKSRYIYDTGPANGNEYGVQLYRAVVR